MNFSKFLRTPFFTEHLLCLLLEGFSPHPIFLQNNKILLAKDFSLLLSSFLSSFLQTRRKNLGKSRDKDKEKRIDSFFDVKQSIFFEEKCFCLRHYIRVWLFRKERRDSKTREHSTIDVITIHHICRYLKSGISRKHFV